MNYIKNCYVGGGYLIVWCCLSYYVSNDQQLTFKIISAWTCTWLPATKFERYIDFRLSVLTKNRERRRETTREKWSGIVKVSSTLLALTVPAHFIPGPSLSPGTPSTSRDFPCSPFPLRIQCTLCTGMRDKCATKVLLKQRLAIANGWENVLNEQTYSIWFCMLACFDGNLNFSKISPTDNHWSHFGSARNL